MNIIFLEKIDSTNTYAKENLDKFDEGTLISTDCQTAGRGRFTRVWQDLGAKNIFVTFILKPSQKYQENFANLTQYLSTCVCKEIETLGIKPQIKWPNDILINNKKVAGILAESVIKKGLFKGIALGIGINLNAEQDSLNKIDRPATALNLEGINIEKNILIKKICDSFFSKYIFFLQNGFLAIKHDYEKYASMPEECTLVVFNKQYRGQFAGFDEKGQLLLSIDREIKSFNMGELV